MKKYKTTKLDSDKSFLSIIERNLFNLKSFDLPQKNKIENIKTKDVDFDIDTKEEISFKDFYNFKIEDGKIICEVDFSIDDNPSFCIVEKINHKNK